jgi:hypothetical protein
MPELFPLTPDYIESFEIEPNVHIITYASGWEQRIELSPPHRGYELSWNSMSSADKNVLVDFYKSMSATAAAFNFYDHHNDETVLVRFDDSLKIKTRKVDIYDVTAVYLAEVPQ